MDKYLNTLFLFERLGGRGIIYGGCLRDHQCGVGPVKDVDIAVQNTPENIAAIAAYERHYLDLCLPVKAREVFMEYGNYPDVIKSISLNMGLDSIPEVNFVILDDSVPFTLNEIARRTDFGICQIAHDGDILFWTNAFEQDLHARTFTYLRDPFDEHQYARSQRRFDRLTAEKYAGWKLIVPGLRTSVFTDGSIVDPFG